MTYEVPDSVPGLRSTLNRIRQRVRQAGHIVDADELRVYLVGDLVDGSGGVRTQSGTLFLKIERDLHVVGVIPHPGGIRRYNVGRPSLEDVAK